VPHDRFLEAPDQPPRTPPRVDAGPRLIEGLVGMAVGAVALWFGPQLLFGGLRGWPLLRSFVPEGLVPPGWPGSPTPIEDVFPGFSATFSAVAGFLILTGGYTATVAAAELVRTVRHAHRRLRDGETGPPWRADHAWDPAGAADETGGEARSFVLRAGRYGALAVLVWVAGGYLERGTRVDSRMSTLVGAAICAYGAYFGAKALGRGLRRWKYGASTLRFSRFPFFLGESLDGRLHVARPLVGCSELVVTLRCIEERYEEQGGGDNASEKTVCYEVYSSAATLDLSRRRESAGLVVNFLLPDLDLPTTLASRPPRYWQVDVRGEAPGIDFAARFLVPVYARPAGASAAPGPETAGPT